MEIPPFTWIQSGSQRGGGDGAFASSSASSSAASSGGACVSCHNFNGRVSLNFKGMDLITSYERLQPSWFARFLIEPQTYRPGVVMPESWSGGVAAHTEILDGDTEAQAQEYLLSPGILNHAEVEEQFA